MIETLDALRPEHLRLLHVIATTNEAPPELLYGSGDVTFAWKMPDVDTGEIHRLWGDSVDWAWRAPTVRILAAQSARQPLRPLTPYGKEFVEDAPPRGGLRKLARSPAGPGNRSDAVRSRPANRRAGDCVHEFGCEQPDEGKDGEECRAEVWRVQPQPGGEQVEDQPQQERDAEYCSEPGPRPRTVDRNPATRHHGRRDHRGDKTPANTAPIVTSCTNLGLDVRSVAWITARASTPAPNAESNTMRCNQSHVRRVVVSSRWVIGR